MRFELAGFGIDVVVIEPGPIKTEFGNTAIANVERVQRDGSPYAAFNVAVAGKIREALDGWMSAAAGSAEDVARAIERALTAGRPRTRYPVTAAARTLMFLRRWLPDRGFDAFLRSQYPTPRPS
jgi:short-subunit dehydrogenase